jgi:hypothetical protein
MLAEKEAMGAIPASARLSPKMYESAEAARKAAEDGERVHGNLSPLFLSILSSIFTKSNKECPFPSLNRINLQSWQSWVKSLNLSLLCRRRLRRRPSMLQRTLLLIPSTRTLKESKLTLGM